MGPRLPGWHELHPLIARELVDRVHHPEPLTPARQSRMTWAARAERTGPIVIKVRPGDDAHEKTQWCAAHLPALGARGYPVPAILWHGMISAQWHVTVQNRLPGRPVTALDGPLLDQALRLVELQAGVGIPAGDRDFTGYVANVLFDDWDDEWADAPRAGPGRPGGRPRRPALPISYRAISGLAHYTRERQSYASSLGDEECAAISAVLDRLQA